MHQILKIIFGLSLFTTLAYAQLPGGNVYIGYSYMSADLASNNRSNLNGWNGSVEGKVLPLIGIVGDFSGEYGTQDLLIPCPTIVGITCPAIHANLSMHNFLFGPRVSVSVAKFRPFAHALIGASHISESASGFSNSDTSFAYALGGGIDYHLIPLVSWRVQADLLQTHFFSATQDNVRISTGLVVRF